MPQPTELLSFYSELAGLHAYWDRQRAGRAMPPWHKFDAVEMAPWLGRLNVVDVERRGCTDAYRYRIFGTEIAAILEREMTGRYVGDGDAAAGALMIETYREIVAGKAPLLYRQNPVEGTRMLPHVRLMLPISEDGSQVSKVLVGIHPLWRRSLPALEMPRRHARSPAPRSGAEPLRLVV
ncbi:MAG: PAS domain-containing protein [Alphaproteobacteria bacterium]